VNELSKEEKYYSSFISFDVRKSKKLELMDGFYKTKKRIFPSHEIEADCVNELVLKNLS
jgi:hypothetical protein